MERLLINTIQLCQQSMQQINNNTKQGDQIQPRFNLSTAVGNGSNSPGFASPFSSAIPAYSVNSSTPGKFGYPASSFSAVDMVFPELMNDIIAGKDVNLKMLLIPNYENTTIKKIKDSDVRLQRNLSMDEFVIAFGRYKRIMGTAFPNRNEEFDLYLAHIIETANIWLDRFNEYHKLFSAKCAVMLIQHNIKIDWSKGDLDLRNMVCAGSKINTCRKCHSTTHSTVMCSVQQQNFQPQRISTLYRNTPDSLGRDVIFVDGLPVCNNFNGFKGCTKPYCKYVHACKTCKSKTHVKVACQKYTEGHQHNDQNQIKTSSKNDYLLIIELLHLLIVTS
ncbi:unnamed protein product [Mytilus coruscus]|uniref:C3H1-type domain-containing protein n=1 Tax=Mytilus coruscus TaxID=42192 RepID=A0A6J8D7F6_MYTCO|nr:unnamed protein product [Mytilus coruscus]